MMSWAETALDHTFRDPQLLMAALTHPSHAGQNYQRLEFLGDRVLGLVIAEWLYELHPEEAEGALSRRLVGLVRKEALAKAARDIKINKVLRASTASESENESNLSDALEAVLGALYLDASYEAVKKLVRRLWVPLLSEVPPQDPKTTLQEWAQGQGWPLPHYEEISRTGPAHAPEFMVKVIVKHHTATATGQSKRAAEQAAADHLLKEIKS
jgi:ribonuclease III